MQPVLVLADRRHQEAAAARRVQEGAPEAAARLWPVPEAPPLT